MNTRKGSTLLAENEGQDYAEFGDDLGKVRLWHLGHHIGIFESTGGVREPHAKFITTWFAKHVEAYPRPHLAFGNWSNLNAYTPDVRRDLTDWQVRMKYDELHVSHDSRMLAMGISIANSLLTSTVVVHKTEEELDDVLVAARKRLKI